MQGWETGLAESTPGIDDPGCLLWAGGTHTNQKPGARNVEASGQGCFWGQL